MYFEHWSDSLEPGDQLRLAGPLVSHVGVYVGHGYVVHAPKGGTARLDPLSVFAGRQVPEFVSRVAVEEQKDVVSRALSMVGKPYDALAANCEHLVNYAQTGLAFSQTVRTIGAIAVVGGLMWAGGKRS